MGLKRYARGSTYKKVGNFLMGGGQQEVQNQVPEEQRQLWSTQTAALKPFLSMAEKVPGMINDDLISKYRGTLTQSPEEASLAGTLSGLSERAAKPYDYNAYLEPLRREFSQQIAPEVRASALRVGAPGASGEMESITRAGERYGESAEAAFGRARQTENQGIGLAGALAQDAAAGGELSRALAQASVLAPLSLTQMGMGMQPQQPQFTSLGTQSNSKMGLADWLKAMGGAAESGAGAASSLAMMPQLMAMCWVADELYGPDDERTHLARRWANSNDTPFTRMYREYGERWAETLHKHPSLKPLVQPLWDAMWITQAIKEGVWDSRKYLTTSFA